MGVYAYVCMCVHVYVLCTYIICINISVCIYINVCWYLFKYACMLVYAYMYVCGYTRMCPYACVGVNRVIMFICMCWLHAIVFQIYLVRSEPSYRRSGLDSDSCSLWTRYIGNSKTDLWDDP